MAQRSPKNQNNNVSVSSTEQSEKNSFDKLLSSAKLKGKSPKGNTSKGTNPKKKRKAASRRRKKINLKPLLLLIPAAVIAAVIILIVTIINNKKTESESVATDLNYYYNLSANAEENIVAAASDELAIVFEDEILTERAFQEGSEVYVRLGLITDNVDSRFYYDQNEQVLIVTDAEKMMTAYLGQNGYTKGSEQVSCDYPVITQRNDEIYVAVDFACEYSSAYYGVYSEPSRVVITYKTGEKTFVDSKKKTQVRVLAGVKAEVVGTVEKDSKLMVIDDLEDWYEVVSPEGWKGYVSASAVSDTYVETVESDYNEPEYTSLDFGKPIKLAWALVNTEADNEDYDDLTEDTGGIINVYSPTWYSLTAGDGSVNIKSDSGVLSSAHEDGYSVWALFGDTDAEVDETVLTHTSLRQSMEDVVLNDIQSMGIDGLNVDFELINSSYGSDYIQFIRELSIKCRNSGIYLSVDNYAPYEFNACYHIDEQSRLCDYVIIMAYDDYVGSGETGPNSSLPFVQEVLEMTLEKVTESKIVMALPFYSRVWTTDSDGELSRKEYSMSGAWELMNEVGETPAWDDTLGLWYDEYTMSGDTVQAWIEDEDTLKVKLDYLSQHSLAGTAYWQLGQEYSDVWDVISQY